MLCSGQFNNGRPCTFNARRGGRFCHQHDPSQRGREQRHQARKKGGTNRRKYFAPYTLPVPLETMQDCNVLINRTIGAMQEGHLDIRSGLVMSFAAWVKVLSLASIKGYDLSTEGAKWGRNIEREAMNALMSIAEKSMHNIEKIEPGAIRAVDALHEKIAVLRRKRFLRGDTLPRRVADLRKVLR